MLERAAPSPRVLIGDFGAIARTGLRELLAQEGLEVLGAAETRQEIIPRLGEVRPDVVLLDLDAEDAPEFAARISAAFPATTVIACSCDKPVMRVFPTFHYGESYTVPFTRVLFAAALKD